LGARYAIDAAMRATGGQIVVVNATGCLEVFSTPYPESAWQLPWIHSLFGNAAAVGSGVAAAMKIRAQKSGNTNVPRVIAQGGDGGTTDIGFGPLSGMFERNDDVLYICYDNEAYMNTGIQRSSSTPQFANATTSPAGSRIPGKIQSKKNLTEIMAAHNIPYVAQTTLIGTMKDLYEKADKAIYTPGAAFLNVMAPCPRGWGYNTEDLMIINKLAADTCYWPLYEVVDGKYHITYKPAKKLPIEEFLKTQKRFRHMFKEGNEWMIEEFQKEVDRRWQELLDLEEMANKE
jgi:pyruvate ferredoxin oxidoreductase beta subunit